MTAKWPKGVAADPKTMIATRFGPLLADRSRVRSQPPPFGLGSLIYALPRLPATCRWNELKPTHLLPSIRSLVLPIYVCHDVASAKAGRSRPRGLR